MIIYEHVNQGGLIMAEKKAWVFDECNRPIPVMAGNQTPVTPSVKKVPYELVESSMSVSEYINRCGVNGKCYE